MTSGITIGTGIELGAGIRVGRSELTLSLDASNGASYPGTGTTWTDLSGFGHDTTLVGTTPWTSNGQTSYFTFNTGTAQASAILDNQAYTKIVIFRYSGGAIGNIISGDNANAHAFWGFSSPYLHSGHNGNWATIQSPIITPANQWVFGAVTFNTATGWRLYLNNNSVVTNGNTDPFSANPAVLEIGGYDGNANNLLGDVALVQIYNRVLNDSEMAQRYRFFQTRFGY